MDALKIMVVVVAAFLALTGIFCLIAAWFAPGVLDRPFFQRRITGTRLAPTRANRTLMSLWSILLGTYFILATLGYATVSFIIFAIWVPFAFVMLKRTFRPRPKA